MKANFPYISKKKTSFTLKNKKFITKNNRNTTNTQSILFNKNKRKNYF